MFNDSLLDWGNFFPCIYMYNNNYCTLPYKRMNFFFRHVNYNCIIPETEKHIFFLENNKFTQKKLIYEKIIFKEKFFNF